MSKYDATGRALLATTWDAVQDVPENIEDIANLTDPGVNKLIGWNTATSAIGFLSPSDVPGLTPPAAGNPATSIGLAAVNGVATTFMRSDAAPALSQAIAPTWTGVHVFANGIGFQVASTSPYFELYETDQAVTEQYWSVAVAAKVFSLSTMSSSGSGSFRFLTATRATGTAVSSVELNSQTKIQPPAGGQALSLYGGTGDNVYQAFYADATAQTTRTAYIGHGLPASSNFYIVTETRNGLIVFTPHGTGTVKVTKSSSDQVTMGDRGGQGALIVHGSGSASNYCHFMYGADENVYIRQGKNTGNIYINDLVPGATTNIGNNSGHVLAVVGVILSNSDDIRSNIFYNRSNTAYNLQWAVNVGGISYGSVFISGAKNGWCGYCIGTGVYGTLMGSGSQYGLYSQSGGYWTLIDDSTTITLGKACAGPSFNATSSRMIKRETGSIKKPREVLTRLRPILYRLLEDESVEQIGLIAEEVHEVCPQLSNGKTVAYDRLALLLLADWQENQIMGEA